MKQKNADDSNEMKDAYLGCFMIIVLVLLGVFVGKYVRDYRYSREMRVIETQRQKDKSDMEQEFKQKAKEVLFQFYTAEKPTNPIPLKTLINEANQGDVNAQIALFCSYFLGWHGEEDRREAVKWLRKAAIQNDGTAMLILSLCYFSGTGVEENSEEAIEWLRLGTVNNENKGWEANMLGVLYEYGLFGLQKDKAEARKWYQKALEQGCEDAEEGLRNLD